MLVNIILVILSFNFLILKSIIEAVSALARPCS